ncbi:DUF2867 domain-containing protein [soil metagenome]
MSVSACAIPELTQLDPGMVKAAWFRDAFRAPVRRARTGITEIFLAIFAHHPMWMKRALIARNRFVSLFGLDAPSTQEILNFEVKSSYRVGDKIGVWPILAMSETELIAGRDNKHLDFRLSVLREDKGETAEVVVSTICVVHNVFGKLYLCLVVPFHKWGLRRLMSNAVAAGRL